MSIQFPTEEDVRRAEDYTRLRGNYAILELQRVVGRASRLVKLLRMSAPASVVNDEVAMLAQALMTYFGPEVLFKRVQEGLVCALSEEPEGHCHRVEYCTPGGRPNYVLVPVPFIEAYGLDYAFGRASGGIDPLFITRHVADVVYDVCTGEPVRGDNEEKEGPGAGG